jgi:hypothetical protein
VPRRFAVCSQFLFAQFEDVFYVTVLKKRKKNNGFIYQEVLHCSRDNVYGQFFLGFDSFSDFSFPGRTAHRRMV